jgi:hypothetical protein
VQTCEENSLTGILEIKYAPDVQITLLVVEGIILDAYRLAAAACEKISPDHLSSLLPSGMTSVRTLSLPLEGVRVAKVLLDWHPPVEVIQAETSAIVRHIDTWGARPITSTLHITWPDAEGFIILPGSSPPRGAIYVSGGQIKGDAAGLEAICAHSTGPCTLARYEARTDVAALQEQIARLRTAFALLVDPVIVRYTELLGQSMAQALMFDLSDTALAKGWHIKFTTNGIADTHTFETLDAAVRAYNTLLAKMLEHITVVIGARLTSAFVVEESNRLSPQFQQILRTHCTALNAALASAGKR